MKAIIDIKTPAGHSLEGFPHKFETDLDQINTLGCILFDSYFDLPITKNVKLNKGDKITIEIV